MTKYAMPLPARAGAYSAKPHKHLPYRKTAALAVCLIVLSALAYLSYALYGEAARWPSRDGTSTAADGKLLMDISNLSEGYFMAAVSSPTEHRMKLRVEKDGQTFTYDLNGTGEYELFPLQIGSGTYAVSLYENVGGKKYAQQGGAVLNASLSSETVAWLYPNQYVNYTQDSPIVAAAAELNTGQGEEQAYEAVCDYMKKEFVYDYVRAVTVSAGQLPDINGSYEKRMGICQDLSAIMVGMLRTMGIPSRIMIGYADDNYHAWTMTTIGGEDRFFDPTAAIGGITEPKEYSLERFY